MSLLGGRSRGRSAKFELILTTRCQYCGVGRSAGRSRGRSATFELILTTQYQYWGGRSAARSRGRSAKFELILTTRCQYQGGWVDLPAYLGVDLPHLNSS